MLLFLLNFLLMGGAKRPNFLLPAPVQEPRNFFGMFMAHPDRGARSICVNLGDLGESIWIDGA